MANAAHEGLREYVAALENEIAALRLGRLVGAPEGLSEVGTAPTQINVSELLDEVNRLKRQKYTVVQHLDEARRALVLADALLQRKYPGGLFDMGKNPELDKILGGLCLSILQNTERAENFVSFAFTRDDAEEPEKSRCIVTVRYADGNTTPEDVADRLAEDNKRLRERVSELETEVDDLETEVDELQDELRGAQ